jgi:DNA replication and repair protein RecF
MTDAPHVTKLSLTDFRNYASMTVRLDSDLIAFAGPNGSGKTNILEALSFLSPGRGLRRAPYDQVARVNGSGGWTVHVSLESQYGETTIGTGLEPQERTRRIRINKEPAQSAEDLLEYIQVLWLTPAMDGLFTGPSADRRRFLDRLTMSLFPNHARHVTDFEKAMRQRNRLLTEHFHETSWLDAVENQMAGHASAIIKARFELVNSLQVVLDAHGSETAFPSSKLAIVPKEPRAQDDAEWLLKAWHDGRRRDMIAGRTLIGPHRDDFSVHHMQKDIEAARASTGEQKALLIGLILAQAELIKKRIGFAPALLLDEVAAHLDPDRRATLYKKLKSLSGQSFMTGTDASLFEALPDGGICLGCDDGTWC